MGISITKSKNGWVEQVIQEVNPLVVMNPNTGFLDYGIYTGIIDLQRRSKCDVSQWAMQGKAHVIGFCHGSDSFHLGYAPCVANIRLNNIYNSQLQDPFKIPSR